jgi:hypothetical protein
MYVANRAPNLPPGASYDLRYAFEIPEPYDRSAKIAVEVYDHEPALAAKPMHTVRFVAGDLPQRVTGWQRLPPANDRQAAAAKALLAEAQSRFRLGIYGRAQELFSADWQFVENTPLREWFRRRAYPKQLAPHTWDAPRLLTFQPRDVLANGNSLVLIAADGTQVRPIEMVFEEGQWRIDWIHGAMPAFGVAASQPAAR